MKGNVHYLTRGPDAPVSDEEAERALARAIFCLLKTKGPAGAVLYLQTATNQLAFELSLNGVGL